MIQPIAMPKLGQSEEEATIVRWLKKEGDSVNKGDILFEMETDKALLEVESFFAGTLLKIVVSEGQTVPVQSTVGYIGDLGEPIPETLHPMPHAQRAVMPAAPKEKPPTAQPVPFAGLPSARSERREPQKGERQSTRQAALSPATTQSPAIFRISPRAAKLAKEAAIDPSPIVGTGPGGRTVERDVASYLKAKGYAQLRITPAAKKLARREKIDILGLQTRGDSGRITVADVRAAMAERPKAMTRMRQVIAERLARSFTSTPHFFVTVCVDMTDLIEFQSELKARGKSYTVTDFILAAVALTLPDFPLVNSTTDGVNIMWHSKVHLGLAVSVEQGLVVPVIRDANELRLEEIHERVSELTAKARAGKLTPAEMTGSTFTISNMGMMDVENFTAIINPGESAILAVSSILKQPTVKDDKVTIRSIMKMTLSSDHRIIDGAMAASFVNAVKTKLEEKSLWKLLA
jgi:pyruvate dehydrogenase E2 component (dihydrolipoamide acetyltransferase)